MALERNSSNRDQVKTRGGCSGFSLVEILVSLSILALFMGSIYALNAQCISISRTQKNLAAASQLLQERIEAFRVADFDDVLTSSGVVNLLANSTLTQSNSCFLSVTPNDIVESVNVARFDASTGNTTGGIIKVTRTGTDVSVEESAALTGAKLVRVDFTVSWKEGGRTVSTRGLSTTLGNGGFTSGALSTYAFNPAVPLVAGASDSTAMPTPVSTPAPSATPTPSASPMSSPSPTATPDVCKHGLPWPHCGHR